MYSRAPYLEFPSSVWVMGPNGESQTQLTVGGVGEGDNSPAWSPGGTMIAFSRDTTASFEDFPDDIYVMLANGTGLKRLTSSSAADVTPAWSPDGSRIVFTSDRSGNFEIYTMKIDGSDVRRLTTNAADDGQAVWAPDGMRIAFRSDRAGNNEIYVMNADGSGVSRRTTNAAEDYSPSWSPDGARIAFSSTRTGDYEIFSMAGNGTSLLNLTTDDLSNDMYPSWSPDGSAMAYAGDPFGDLDVLVAPAGGGAPTAIAAEEDDEFNPDWQPIPAFPLVDARFSTFKGDIEYVFNEGITVGCSPERYCPTDSVTRGQMATFLVRALDLPATTTDYFTDDESSSHEGNINRVRAAGITSGCSPTTYCPDADVTREQMATFLAKGFSLPTSSTDYFTDDETSSHEGNINRVRAAGITTGCTATTYCPKADVTRGQMAAFLRRALEE